MLQWG